MSISKPIEINIQKTVEINPCTVCAYTPHIVDGKIDLQQVAYTESCVDTLYDTLLADHGKYTKFAVNFSNIDSVDFFKNHSPYMLLLLYFKFTEDGKHCRIAGFTEFIFELISVCLNKDVAHVNGLLLETLPHVDCPLLFHPKLFGKINEVFLYRFYKACKIDQIDMEWHDFVLYYALNGKFTVRPIVTSLVKWMFIPEFHALVKLALLEAKDLRFVLDKLATTKGNISDTYIFRIQHFLKTVKNEKHNIDERLFSDKLLSLKATVDISDIMSFHTGK